MNDYLYRILNYVSDMGIHIHVRVHIFDVAILSSSAAGRLCTRFTCTLLLNIETSLKPAAENTPG